MVSGTSERMITKEHCRRRTLRPSRDASSCDRGVGLSEDADMTVTHRIEINPKIMMGKPVIRGTRITVELLLRKLAEGATEKDLLDAYPRLTREDIRAAIGYAADTVAHEETLMIPPTKRKRRA